MKVTRIEAGGDLDDTAIRKDLDAEPSVAGTVLENGDLDERCERRFQG